MPGCAACPPPPPDNARWALALMEGLQRAGVRYVCCSPGARSAPLAWAAWQMEKRCGAEEFSVIVHWDERAAAFAALGMAHASGRPAAVLTTSGSAAANLLPAVVEAWHSGIPLLLLTADRPRRLRGSGANQTIQQPGIFGHFVARCADLPASATDSRLSLLPEGLEPLLGWLIEPLFEAWPLPCHLNVPLEEPLLTAEGIEHEQKEPAAEMAGTFSFPKNRRAVAKCPDLSCPERVLAGRGWIVVGELSAGEQEGWPEFCRLAVRLGWPLLADPLAGPVPDEAPLLDHYDLWLDEEAVARLGEPERVIHLGGRLTSKALWRRLGALPSEALVQVRRGPGRLDPVAAHPRVIFEEPVRWAAVTADGLSPECSRHGDWQTRWMRAGQVAARSVACALKNWRAWSEPLWARVFVERAAERRAAVFLGNSLAIRLVDSFARPRSGPVFGQRGASGIDGNLAHIAGLARALRRPVFALLGDMAFLHDATSLGMLRGLPVVVFVTNNEGGAIFGTLDLPVPGEFHSRFLQAPHRVELGKLCDAFGVSWRRFEGAVAEGELEAFLEEPAWPKVAELRCRAEDTLKRVADLRETCRADVRSACEEAVLV